MTKPHQLTGRSTDKIASLNDTFRRTFIGGRVLITPSVLSLPADLNELLLERVRTFAEFNSDNDPRHEHDFGSIEVKGERYLWKIDYYDPLMQRRSDDPADHEKTERVLTIMRADE